MKGSLLLHSYYFFIIAIVFLFLTILRPNGVYKNVCKVKQVSALSFADRDLVVTTTNNRTPSCSLWSQWPAREKERVGVGFASKLERLVIR
jgi:surface polysaccharide O-acyltransferase-like enzyme